MAIELSQKCNEKSPGTYSTIAISEYKSSKISIIRVYEELVGGDQGTQLRYEYLKEIKLTFHINYGLQAVPSDPNLIIAIGEKPRKVCKSETSRFFLHGKSYRYCARLVNLAKCQNTSVEILAEKDF
jgi:hypothetical protein